MSDGHDSLREALGAYALGVLDADERTHVEGHLRDCTACRDELASLAALPDLLAALTPDEADMALEPLSHHRRAPATAPAGDEQRRLRRALWTWRAAAAAAAAALVVVLAPWSVPDPRLVFEPRPVVAEAAPTQGRVEVAAQPWGMHVTVDVRDLPPRRGYSLWAVDGEGHRSLAASWSRPPSDAVRLDGSCYMSVDDLAHFELSAPDEELLATFQPSA